jgi:hypothetical protein
VAAQLGSQRVAGIAQHAVEQMLGGTHSGEPFELTACRLIFSDRLGCGIKWDERGRYAGSSSRPDGV